MKLDKDKAFRFVIPGHPATKKNSPVLVRGRAVVLPSKAYKAYEKVFRKELSRIEREQGRLPHYSGPVQLTAKYYLQDRRAYPDLNGLIQATQDIISDEHAYVDHRKTLKRRWILEDDRLVKSLDGTRIAGIDKDNPRVEILIEPMEVDIEREPDPQLVKMAKEATQGNLFRQGEA